MGKQIEAIFIDSKNGEVVAVSLTGGMDSRLKELQIKLDCRLIDAVRLPNGDVIYVDDEGLFDGKEDFFCIRGAKQPLAGSGVIMGTTRGGKDAKPKTTLEWVKDNLIFTDIHTLALTLRVAPELQGESLVLFFLQGRKKNE